MSKQTKAKVTGSPAPKTAKLTKSLGPQKVKGEHSNVTGKKLTILKQTRPKWTGK
jgi:hypothetical protein